MTIPTITIDGNDVTEYVISSEYSQNICTSVGAFTVVLDSSYNMNSINTFDTVTVNGMGFYNVLSVEKNYPDSTLIVSCQDNSILLMYHFIVETYNTEDTKYKCSYWIKKFFDEAGTDYNFEGGTLGSGSDSLVSNNTYLGMCSAYDAVMPLLAQCGWYMWFDYMESCHISSLKQHYAGGGLNLDDTQIMSVRFDINDKLLRNRAVVWGAGNEDGSGYVFADLRVDSPWTSGVDRTVVIQNSNIPTNEVATELAHQVLEAFSSITYTTTLDIAGLTAGLVGTPVSINSHYKSGSGVITSFGYKTSTNGIITTITIGERCPRLFGYFGLKGSDSSSSFNNVYIGTANDGIWCKPISPSGMGGNTWTDFSTGLEDYNTTDLSISYGTFASIVNKKLYTRFDTDVAWTPYTIPDLVTISGDVIPGNLLEAQACTINPINNNIQFLVNISGAYTETVGFPYLTTDCKSWLMNLSGVDRDLIYFPITISGVNISGVDDNLYSYDLDTDGRYTYVSIINSSEPPVIPSGIVYSGEFTELQWIGSPDYSYNGWNPIFELCDTYETNPYPPPPTRRKRIIPPYPVLSYLGNGIIQATGFEKTWIWNEGIGSCIYDTNDRSLRWFFRMQYSGPDNPEGHLHLSMTHLTGLVVGGFNQFQNYDGTDQDDGNSDMWNMAVPYHTFGYPGYDGFNQGGSTTFAGLTLWGWMHRSMTPEFNSEWVGLTTGEIVDEIPSYGHGEMIHTGEDRWLAIEMSNIKQIIGTATWRINKVWFVPNDPTQPEIVFWEPSAYSLIRTNDGMNYERLSLTPSLAKIELSKGSPVILYGGNEYFNNGFVYYSTDGQTFNNLNLIATDVLGNPALDANGFVSDVRNFDAVSGVYFGRYTGIVQHNIYNGNSAVRLTSYDANPVWQSPYLTEAYQVLGQLDKMETSNHSYIHTPYVFLSTTLSGTLSSGGGAGYYSDFYQIDEDQITINKYNDNLPPSKITVIRVDDSI